MSRNQPAPDRKNPVSEDREGLLGRRLRAFADRSREPGDAATWAAVIGSLMWTMLIICYSVAGQALVAAFSLLGALVWIGIMGRFGNVNVTSILWGSAATDYDRVPVLAVVFQSTLVVALISLIAAVIDAFSGWNFGWYGFILLVTVASYLVLYIQAWLQPVR